MRGAAILSPAHSRVRRPLPRAPTHADLLVERSKKCVSPCVSSGYTRRMCMRVERGVPSLKDAGLRIRVDRTLRDEFLTVCREQDKPGAQVIREFMREYVRQHKEATELTPAPSKPSKRELSNDH